MAGSLQSKPCARKKTLFRLTAAFLAFSFLASPELAVFGGAGSAQAAGQDSLAPAQKLMSAEDKATVRSALTAAGQKRWTAAEQLAAQTRDPLAAKIYYWLSYTEREAKVPFNRLSSFVRQNPDWPRQGKLILEAEEAMPPDLPDDEVLRWFRDYSPRTPDGMERFLRTLDRAGAQDEMRKVLGEWWKDAPLTAEQQTRFLQRYGTYIEQSGHTARFNALIEREQYTAARGMARYLGKGYPALADARVALAQGKGGVDAALARVPPHLKDDPGLMFERLRWRRRNNLDVGAIAILHTMPPIDQISNPDEWWTERNILIRRLIEGKQYESAYMLAEKHGMKQGVSFAEAEFLAGWLALRFLDRPWRAFEHFEALYHKTETPISRSRGAYWAARASDALGHPEIARQWYRTAARHQTTFYGQLAAGALADEFKPPQQVPPPITLPGKQAFDTQEMVQAARLLAEAGLRDESIAFLDSLAASVRTGEDYRLVSEMAVELGYDHVAVKIAKKGLNKGVLLMDQLYPTLLTQMRGVSMEWALVHALIRQESAFDPKAVSSAGARGLMQLMPATAREVARKLKVPYSPSRLTSDPAYNIKLGTYYMGEDMLDRYDNSYALALAAYNGGPGRVSGWLKEFGDPRKGEIDIIDWIELIPVAETRNYVQRVLEGVYVYRVKLKDVQKSYDHVAMKKIP